MDTYIGKPQTIKKVNENIVFNAIASNPGVSQVQIADSTGLSLQTVNKVVRSLEAKGSVICTGISTYTGGRRARVYEINENKGYIVCVYIQGNHFYCKITNIMEKELTSQIYYKKQEMDWSDNLLHVLDAITKTIDSERIEIIGIAVPGTVTNNRINNIPAIPEWEGMDLKKLISEHYPCRVWIENDIKSATMGACSEYLHENNQNMAYISILDHIGSAVIINRKLYNSCNSFAGELAYMAVGEYDRKPNQCGCADSILEKALLAGDKDSMIALIVRLLVNICCVMDPDLIVIATPHLSKDDIPKIKSGISRYIHNDYIPAIIIDDVIAEKNLDGIISLCRNKIEAAMQIIKA